MYHVKEVLVKVCLNIVKVLESPGYPRKIRQAVQYFDDAETTLQHHQMKTGRETQFTTWLFEQLHHWRTQCVWPSIQIKSKGVEMKQPLRNVFTTCMGVALALRKIVNKVVMYGLVSIMTWNKLYNSWMSLQYLGKEIFIPYSNECDLDEVTNVTMHVY